MIFSTVIKYLSDFIKTHVEGNQGLQKIVSNTSWLFFDNILRMGVGLLIGIWIARYLGPDHYGQLNYALAFVALFSSFASLGLNNLVVRNIVQDPTSKNDILGTTFVLQLIGGLIAFGMALVAIFLLRPADNQVRSLVAIVAAGTIFQAFDTINLWFQSQMQSKFSVIAKNVAFLILNFAKIVLIILKASLIAFVWAGLAEIVLGSIGLIVAFRFHGHSLRAWHASLSLAKVLLHDSWPLIFSGVVSMIYLRIDQVMLGEIRGSDEVGVYSAAVRLAEVWYFIPMAIVSSVFPSVVEARKSSDEIFYNRLQKLYNVMALIGYLVALPITFMAGWIVELLFGAAYRRAAFMLAVLVWAGLFVNLGVARSSFLMSMNWTKSHLLTVFLGSIVNVGLNLLLIPLYGGVGAAVASCVAYWVAAHGSCFVYKPLYKTGYMLTRAIIAPRVW